MYFLKNRKTRELALQIMYSCNISKIKDIKLKIKEFQLIKINILKNINLYYLYKILNGIKKNKKYIKKIILKSLSIKETYIGKIEFFILNIAIYELKINNKIPYKIIIDESIKLAKKFGCNNSYKLINKILDKIYKYKKNKNIEK